MKTRKKAVVLIIITLSVMLVWVKEWIPFHRVYLDLEFKSYSSVIEKIEYAALSLIGIILSIILISSVVSLITGKHKGLIESYCLLWTSIGLIVGGFLFLLSIMFGYDQDGIIIFSNILLFSSILGLVIGIKNEIENDEGVC